MKKREWIDWKAIKREKNKLTAGLAMFFLVMGGFCPAFADVLDFEGLTAGNRMELTVPYNGFVWDNTYVGNQWPWGNVGWTVYNDDYNGPYGNYTLNPAHSGNYAIVNDYEKDPLGVEAQGSATFDFNGAWVSAWRFDQGNNQYFTTADTIKAQGFDLDGDLVAETAWFTLPVGQSQYLLANFQNVHRVNFVGGGAFTIDDFTYNVPTGVPEPATMLLYLSGLLALFGFRRKLRK